MRRLLLLPLLLLAFLVPVPAAPAQPSPLAGVQEVLDRRVAALNAGDRNGWLATVDPAAPAAFRSAQARSFDGLRSLPIETYALRARTDDSGDLGVGLSSRYGNAPVFLPETRQVYRLRGFDDRDAVDTLWLTYVQRDGRWYVAGDDDLSAVGLDTGRNIWDLGPVRVVPTTHFLVISHPGDAARADALAGIAEEAIGQLNSRWDHPWSQRIPLVLPGSVRELETILQSTFDLNNFVAFVVYNSVRDDSWVATAPRIYIQDNNLRRYSRQFQLETLTHELSHAAAVPLAGPLIPAWVHEGLADWLAKGQSSRERPPKGSDGLLPRDYEFSTGGGPSIVKSYDESRSAMSALSAMAGIHAPSTLLQVLGEPKVAPGSVDHNVDAGLRRVSGRGFAEFQRIWASRRP